MLRRLGIFVATFIPISLVFLWLYAGWIEVYEPLPLQASNAIQHRLAPGTRVAVLDTGHWQSFFDHPDGREWYLRRWDAPVKHMIFLNLVLLPGLLLATPAPWRTRLVLLALGLLGAFLCHVLAITTLVRGYLYLRTASDGAGNVYVADGGGASNAFRITPDGVVTSLIDATGDGVGNPLTGTQGIAVDGFGNVFVSATVSLNVFRITPGGTVTEILDATGDGAGATLGMPWGLATDSSGNVYVADDINDQVFKVTPGGAVSVVIDVSGDGTGNGLDIPRYVAVDAADNLYASGIASKNVLRLDGPPPAVPGTSPWSLGLLVLCLLGGLEVLGRRQAPSQG